MSLVHLTLSGRELRYEEPRGELAAFLERLQRAAEDPAVSEDAMTALVYGRENPLLEQGVFADRGAVTPEVFANPLYHVMGDLLGRKRVQAGTLDLERAAARFTMSVPEAAARLGVTEGAVRQAIERWRLAAWRKGARLFLDPEAVERYQVGTTGPKPQISRGGLLLVRVGSAEGVSFRLRRRGDEQLEQEASGGAREGSLVGWRRIAIIAGKGERYRFWALEPGEEEQVIEFEGFYVRGRFVVAAQLNNSRKAVEAWKAFEPA